MQNFKCPSCGSDRIEIKKIIHTINGGNNSALIDVYVEVCEMCGEILFTPEQVCKFEEIKNKLEKGHTDNFIPIGKNFRVA
ncbi:MAG: YgiT-type zinc finger protein [Candidatus Melainabacteria bacterium]|nr:YgiT-type zinc finger protein [Candidatus Melainabacteria bacterium]